MRTGATPARRRRSWPRRLGRWLIIAVSAWLAGHVAALLWVGYADDLRPADVAVILGNGVNRDGSPGPVLRDRLDRALELYHAGLCRYLLASGASIPGGYNEPVCMRRYLRAHGVPDAAIVLDEGGSNTFHTALNTRRLMREHGWVTVAVVSQYYHILRTRLAFARAGIADVRSAHARSYSCWHSLWGLGREIPAYYRYLFRAYPAEDGG